jgi:hypothetical protein
MIWVHYLVGENSILKNEFYMIWVHYLVGENSIFIFGGGKNEFYKIG